MMNVKVLVGCNYPPNDTRAEPGDLIEVDAKVGAALIAAGAAEAAEKPKKKSATTKTNKSASTPQNVTEG
jgi:hypothetical protein